MLKIVVLLFTFPCISYAVVLSALKMCYIFQCSGAAKAASFEGFTYCCGAVQ